MSVTSHIFIACDLITIFILLFSGNWSRMDARQFDFPYVNIAIWMEQA